MKPSDLSGTLTPAPRNSQVADAASTYPYPLAVQNRPAITLFTHRIRMAKDVDFYDSLQKKTSLYLVLLRWLNMVLMGLRYGYPNVHLQRRE